jgi:H+-transporting ATPase
MHGLDDAEVEKRRADFGPNELKEEKKNPILKFLGYFTGAIAYLIEVACIISAVVGVSKTRNACSFFFLC